MKQLPYYNTFFQTSHPPVISLSEKLNHILSDRKNLEEVKIKGVTLVNTKYDWLEIGKQTKISYQSIL